MYSSIKMVESEKKNIVILLATFNGIKYIKEQIDSSIDQADVNITIYVSDDFSTDGTWEWLQNIASEKIILLPRIERFGSAGANFFRLINDVPIDNFDYVAFCDQDDIWFQDKLIRAVDAIEKNNCNAYSSNVTAFWADGRKMLIDKAQPQQEWDFFFEAAGPGCTYVIKSDMAKQLGLTLAGSRHSVRSIEMHDWFIYAWARHNGFHWFIDEKPGMYYRQHSTNVVGVNNGFLAAKSRFKMLSNGWYLKQILLTANAIGALDVPPILWVINSNFINKFNLLRSAFKCRRRLRDRLAFIVFIVMLSSCNK